MSDPDRESMTTPTLYERGHIFILRIDRGVSMYHCKQCGFILSPSYHANPTRQPIAECLLHGKEPPHDHP
jgi:hypothetical protein